MVVSDYIEEKKMMSIIYLLVVKIVELYMVQAKPSNKTSQVRFLAYKLKHISICD